MCVKHVVQQLSLYCHALRNLVIVGKKTLKTSLLEVLDGKVEHVQGNTNVRLSMEGGTEE